MTTTNPTENRWFGYCRVSTGAQVQGTSLEEQQRRVEAVANYHGATLTTLFVDEGVSGSIPLGQRPKGFELVAGTKRGDTVVVSKLDRAFRSTLDALAVIERFRASGVQVIMADISVEPLTQDGVGRLFFTILASLAEFERERIRERTVSGKRRKAEAGGYIGGLPPAEMHFERDANGVGILTLPEENKPVLALACDLYTKGVPLRDIEALVKDEFPDNTLAQRRTFHDWWRYFKRIKLEAPPKNTSIADLMAGKKAKSKAEKERARIKRLRATPLLPKNESYF